MKKEMIMTLFSFILGIFFGGFATYLYMQFDINTKAEIFLMQGLNEFERKNYHKGNEFYNMAIGLNFGDHGSHIFLGDSYKKIGLNNLAQEKYSIALKLNKARDRLEIHDRNYILKQIDLLKEKEVKE